PPWPAERSWINQPPTASDRHHPKTRGDTLGRASSMNFPLSVLDLSPLTSGRTARDALLATVDLARHTEGLGPTGSWRSPRSVQMVGGPERIAEALTKLAAEAQAEELMITTAVHSHEARKRSYTLIAEVLGEAGPNRQR